MQALKAILKNIWLCASWPTDQQNVHNISDNALKCRPNFKYKLVAHLQQTIVSMYILRKQILITFIVTWHYEKTNSKQLTALDTADKKTNLSVQKCLVCLGCQGGKFTVRPRAKNGSSTKIGVVWQKLDFWAKNQNFGPKIRESLLVIHHVLATTGKSCSKKKKCFCPNNQGGNVILGDFLGENPF